MAGRIDELVTMQSVLVPADLLPPEKYYAWIESYIRLVVNEAKIATKGAKKLTVRDLDPSDLGLTNDVWWERTGATANQYEDSAIASKTIADKTWVCIWGITDNSSVPSVSLIRFDVGGSKAAIWNLDKLNQMEHRVAIAMSPIIIKEAMTLTIEHYVKVASSQVEICFDGVAVEIEGLKIKP